MTIPEVLAVFVLVIAVFVMLTTGPR